MKKVMVEKVSIELIKASTLPLTEKEASYLYDECLSGSVTWGDADKTLISVETMLDYLRCGDDERITKRIEKKFEGISGHAYIDLEN